jgi:dipeptidyl aminopeptidase/acylaminoacyl peptidase
MAVARANDSTDSLTGHWVGEWTREGARLPVSFDFFQVAGRDTGTFDSEQLRAIGIPLSRVKYTSPRVHFELVGDVNVTRFDGELHDREVAGTFSADEQRGTFHLKRSGTPASPPYDTQEVRFDHGDVRLAGSLFVPRGKGPWPAIVFLHGSGPEGRYANRFLADRFARAGIAALIYDKRGVGSSGGDWHGADFEALAGDAAAAVHLLAADARIRADAIGLHGHSQGGTYAPLVAAQTPEVSFVIASGASGVSVLESERYSLTSFEADRHLDREDSLAAARYIDLVTRVAYQGAPYAQLDSLAAADSSKKWFFPVPKIDDPYWAFSRAIAGYDPLAWWAKVHVPVLLIYGERDERVPVDVSVRNIAGTLRRAGNRDVTAKVFPEADHTFRLPSPPSGTFRWPQTVAGYPATLIDWVSMHTSPGSRR